MKKILVLFLSLAFMACGPISKEGYLERYAEFMNQVAAESSEYTESDWAECDNEFKKLSEELYAKFKPELTNSEKMKLAGYELKYAYYRGLSQSGEILKRATEGFSSTLDTIGTEVSNGIEHLGREVKELTDSLGTWEEMVDDAVEQMEKVEQSVVEAYEEAVREIEQER